MSVKKILFSVLYIYLILLQIKEINSQDNPSFNSLSITENFSLKIPWDDIYETNSEPIENCSGKYSVSAKLKCKDIQIHIFNILPYQNLITFDNSFTQTPLDKLKNNTTTSWGISFTTVHITGIPITFKAGALSGSGSISFLKNPQFSSIHNPLLNSINRDLSFSVSLPSYASSTQKPLSIAVTYDQYFFPENFINYGYFTLTTAYNEEGMFSTGINIKIKPIKNIFLETALSGGRFYLSPRTTTSWFLTTPFFHEKWQTGFVFSISEHSLHSKIRYITGFQENPFNQKYFWFRNENIFNFNNFYLGANFFFTDIFLNSLPDLINNNAEQTSETLNGGSIICADNTLLTTHFQMIFRPMYIYKFQNDATFKIGTEFYTELEKIAENEFLFVKTYYIGSTYQSTKDLKNFSINFLGGINNAFSKALTSDEKEEPETRIKLTFSKDFTKGNFITYIFVKKEIYNTMFIVKESTGIEFNIKEDSPYLFYIRELITYNIEKKKLANILISLSLTKKLKKINTIIRFNIINNF